MVESSTIADHKEIKNMAPTTRRCKECGKLFVPRGREQYCQDTHYRPCPICGKPVEVKYLSDPARKCDDCRYRKVKPAQQDLAPKSKSLFNFIPNDVPAVQIQSEASQPVSEIEHSNQETDESVDLDWMSKVEGIDAKTVDTAEFCEHITGTVMVYMGKKFKNSFIPGHQYLLKVQRNEYSYDVSATEDLSTGEICDISRPYASQISFYQSFGKLKE